MNSFSNKTIEALKMAVEAVEGQAFGKYRQEVVAKLKEALTEAEQKEKQKEALAELVKLNQEMGGYEADKQEWQSLSDDEIRHLKYEYADYTLYDEGDGVCPEVELEVEEFARAIEQALKEKNHE